MKILYLSRGCTIHDIRFLAGFVNNGQEISFLTTQFEPLQKVCTAIPKEVKYYGSLDIQVNPATTELDAASKRLVKKVSEISLDIILAGPITDAAYIVSKSGLLIPWVAHSWAFDVLWEAKNNQEASNRLVEALKSCSGLLADCEAIGNACSQISAPRNLPIFVMPWGLESSSDIKQNKIKIRRKLGLLGRKILLFTRGLEKIYGIETLLEAFVILHRRLPSAALVLASQGSLLKFVEEFIKREKLGSSIRVVGNLRQKELLDLMSGVDGYVSPAQSDGTSISLLQALSIGLPAVVTNVGGNREWIVPGRNGWIVPNNDPKMLAGQAFKILNLSKFEIHSIKIFNRTLLEQKADWNSNFKEYVRFLNSIQKKNDKLN